MSLPLKIYGHEVELAELSALAAKIALARERGELTELTPLLLVGPSKIGKFTMARRLAALLFCEKPDFQAFSPCARCAACRHAAAGGHPDLLVLDRIYAENVESDLEKIYATTNLDQSGRRSREVKTEQIGADDVREIINAASSSSLGGLRVVLIKRVDRATPEAQNVLLKILEEPHPGLFFVFTTTDEERLLPTFTSRLRAIRCRNLSSATYEKALAELAPDLSVTERERVAFLSQGRIGRGREFLADPALYEEFRALYEKLEHLVRSDSLRERFALAEELAKEKGDLNRFLRIFTYYFHNLLHGKITGKADEKGLRALSLEKITDILRAVEIARRQLRANVNARLALEQLMLAF